MKLYDKLFDAEKFTLTNGKTVSQKFTRMPLIILLLLIGITVSVWVTGFSLTMLFTNITGFWQILASMFPPKLSYFFQVWRPLLMTIQMSFFGSFFGSLMALPFAVLAASNITNNRVINLVVRFILTVVRTIPTLVSALIATYIFGLGTFAGTVAIFLFSFSFVGKQLFEYIETVDMGAYEALMATGADTPRAFVTTIFPQILPTYLSTALFAFEGNVRYAAILGYVGAGGIGMILNEKIGWREFQSVGMILLSIFVAVVIIETVSQQLRKYLS
ncbi:phosphonate ABC transporter, permease protein PhnE [Leuconostoc gelidum subsp. gasicomitatum]|uniref:phosphonate ABC transporter, permease protein PhnE n=1 Tax=Leuconostoc gasicomitatum TaxID=115778 RepID=UPI001CC5B9AB|nr:phosphonate ABC transporter, permease protein PhnE [Leuconostoc gasicomitatum]MBZ5984670.1 phosphonate ABC transporter, permease protein PhnE [Leuconostoc gasicomitatum]